jgi:drug/metabolite transporter (DMT)-like permease
MLSPWVFLALISAFSLATSDALTKKALSIHNEYIIAWLRLFCALPLLIICLFFIPFPELKRDFYIAFSLSIPLEILALIWYIKALKLSPLSLTLPFLSLTPVFLIFIPFIMIGERITFLAGVGVVLIATGSYMLNLKEFKKGLFEPFFAIVRERGSLLMIGVAFIYSITSTLGKRAIESSSPIFFGVTYFLAVFLFLTPLAIYKGRDEIMMIFKNGALRSSLLPGFFQSIMIISHMLSLGLTKVAYMISVKRLSLLIGVIYGRLIFRESNFKERIFGSLLMLLGFLLIVLFHD